MKRVIFLFAFTIAASVNGLKAQPWITGSYNNIYYNNGNVGIGTTSPSYKLDVNGLIHANSLYSPSIFGNYLNMNTYGTETESISTTIVNEEYEDGCSNYVRISAENYYSGGYGELYIQTYANGTGSDGVAFWVSGYRGLGIMSKVGIGTTNPLSNFQVSTTTNANSMTLGSTNGIAFSIVKGEEQYGLYSGISGNGNAWLQAGRTNTPTAYNLLLQASGGNVGIGTTTPQNKLDVAGTIRCTEVKVVALPWADFVFRPTYKLRTLSDVEQFIKANNHLPEIPSEKEVKENGIGLGEMNAKLLQKIEELTLYMIEQQRRIQELEKQNQRITEIENQLKIIINK